VLAGEPRLRLERELVRVVHRVLEEHVQRRTRRPRPQRRPLRGVPGDAGGAVVAGEQEVPVGAASERVRRLDLRVERRIVGVPQRTQVDPRAARSRRLGHPDDVVELVDARPRRVEEQPGIARPGRRRQHERIAEVRGGARDRRRADRPRNARQAGLRAGAPHRLGQRDPVEQQGVRRVRGADHLPARRPVRRRRALLPVANPGEEHPRRVLVLDHRRRPQVVRIPARRIAADGQDRVGLEPVLEVVRDGVAEGRLVDHVARAVAPVLGPVPVHPGVEHVVEAALPVDREVLRPVRVLRPRRERRDVARPRHGRRIVDARGIRRRQLPAGQSQRERRDPDSDRDEASRSEAVRRATETAGGRFRSEGGGNDQGLGILRRPGMTLDNAR
jgi:hypothetical protein